MAAEITCASRWRAPPPRCFNEAAANGRGNHALVRHASVGVVASMRPRRMAAEILRGRRADIRRAAGFNEAAANGRGNRLGMDAVRAGAHALQ